MLTLGVTVVHIHDQREIYKKKTQFDLPHTLSSWGCVSHRGRGCDTPECIQMSRTSSKVDRLFPAQVGLTAHSPEHNSCPVKSPS